MNVMLPETHQDIHKDDESMQRSSSLADSLREVKDGVQPRSDSLTSNRPSAERPKEKDGSKPEGSKSLSDELRSIRANTEEAEAKEKQTTPEAIIADIAPDLNELADRMKQGIIEGRWDSIIGDETSGRLPTLFFHRLMQRYAQEHGSRAPKVVFMQGDKEERYGSAKDAMNQYTASRRQDIGDRALYVSEYGATGDSLGNAYFDLPPDITLDVAMLRANSEAFDRQRFKGGKISDLMIGRYEPDAPVPLVHDDKVGKTMSGVKKRHIERTDYDPDIESSSYPAPTTQRSPNYNPELVTRARELINKLADETYERLFNQN